MLIWIELLALKTWPLISSSILLRYPKYLISTDLLVYGWTRYLLMSVLDLFYDFVWVVQETLSWRDFAREFSCWVARGLLKSRVDLTLVNSLAGLAHKRIKWRFRHLKSFTHKLPATLIANEGARSASTRPFLFLVLFCASRSTDQVKQGLLILCSSINDSRC